MGLLNDSVTDSVLGLPWAGAEMSAAKTGLQYDPATATRMALAKDPLSLDQAMMADAQSKGDSQGYLSAYLKSLTDANRLHISSMSGNVTGFGLPPWVLASMANYNPQSGKFTANGRQQLIPGATDTEQALEAAEARGKAAGEVERVWNPATQQYEYVPRSNITGGRAPPAAAGPANSSGSGISAAPGPQQGSFLSSLGRESGGYVQQLQEGADAAVNANYALDQMLKDSEKVSLGPAAGAKEWGLKNLTAVGQVFGVNVPSNLADYQELDKYANQIAFAATRQMGSREAAQIVHLQMQSNPNKELTAGAFTDLAQSMKAMNNYLIAKNQALQQAARTNGGDAMQAAAQWTKTVDPRVWDLALSPQMGEKWAATIGKNKIQSAWQYLSPDEQAAVVRNIPMSVRQQWLKPTS